MADISLTGQLQVATLVDRFFKEFGLTLRVYDGRSYAEPQLTLAQVRKRKAAVKNIVVSKNMHVGNLEEKIKEEYGLVVQFSGSDDSYLCNNEHTLYADQLFDQKKLGRKARKIAQQEKILK